MYVGILTGGGDCPGLNAVIRAVVQKIYNHGGKVFGIYEGWRGMIEGSGRPLTPQETAGFIDRGGTILGTSRTNPYKDPNDRTPVTRIKENFHKLGLTALIAVGGEDTLGVAARLYQEEELPLVGVPKTIDNDLQVTDYTFGFDTAVNIAVEAIDRLRTTAESHRRVMVVETMGRHAGWIACYAGIAAAADYIVVPEVPLDLEDLCRVLRRKRAEGKNYAIVVVGEGAQVPGDEAPEASEKKVDQFGHVQLGGVGYRLAQLIEKKTGWETRCTVIGYLQRGGAPTAFDRVLATRLGIHAAEAVLDRKFGVMVALKGTQIVTAALAEAARGMRPLDVSLYQEAREFFI
jgi:phosphofructokinase-like protein